MIKKRLSVFLLPMFLLILLSLTVSLNSVVPGFVCVYVASINYIFNLHRFPTKRLLHSMLKDLLNWTNCFSSHIVRNNLRAKKRRKFTARNASLCPGLYVWENRKYFNNKVQVSMRTWKNKRGLGNTIKRNFAHANSYNFADKQYFKVFR